MIATGEPRDNLDAHFVRPDGTTIWGLVSHGPVRDDDGRRIGWLHRVTPYTERSGCWTRCASASSCSPPPSAIAQIGSWEWDVASDTVTWSDQLYRIYDVDPDEFEATYAAFLEFIHPEDRADGRGGRRHRSFDGRGRVRLGRPDRPRATASSAGSAGSGGSSAARTAPP